MRLITMLNKDEGTIVIDMKYERRGQCKIIRIDGYSIEESEVQNEQSALERVCSLLACTFSKEESVKMKIISIEKIRKWFTEMLKLKINDISEKSYLPKIEMF